MSWKVATDSDDRTILYAAYGEGFCYALRPDGLDGTRLAHPPGLEPVDDDEYEIDADAAREWALERLDAVKFATSTRAKIAAALKG